MKKYLLLVLCIAIYHISTGQLCTNGLSPNTGSRGQTLTTTLTNTHYSMGNGSAPCNPNDVYMRSNVTGDTIFASTFSFSGDSINVSWNIPANAAVGGYDLSIDFYEYSTVNGNCLVGPLHCNMPQRFGIDASIISGMVYFDSNLDSVFNSPDYILPNQRVLLLPDSVFTFTDASGNYWFFADTGTHTVKVIPSTYFIPATIDSIVVNNTGSNITNVDFGLYASTTSYNVSGYIWGRARCNTEQNYNVFYYNFSTVPVNLVIKVYHTPNTVYQSSSILPDSTVGDTIYFSKTAVTYSYGYIDVYFLIPAAGDTISIGSTLVAYDVLGNVVATDDDYWPQIVSCSYDPNDKAVNPPGELAQHYTLFGEQLTYNIRFQNTGNDTAYAIHIIDTLDSDLDFSSFSLVGSSHPVVVEMTTDGIVDFIFNNIMLPDSFVDEPSSHGWVNYSIDHKPGLPENTVINNIGYIYFDQNAPVLTNVTENTMVTQIPVIVCDCWPGIAGNVYPNPFTSSIIFDLKLDKQTPFELTVTDMQGREVYFNTSVNSGREVDLHILSSGVYMYKLQTETGQTFVGKLVKQ